MVISKVRSPKISQEENIVVNVVGGLPVDGAVEEVTPALACRSGCMRAKAKCALVVVGTLCGSTSARNDCVRSYRHTTRSSNVIMRCARVPAMVWKSRSAYSKSTAPLNSSRNTWRHWVCDMRPLEQICEKHNSDRRRRVGSRT